MAWVKSRIQQEQDLMKTQGDMQARAQSRQMEHAAWQSLMEPPPPPQPQISKLPIDWQHSADTGAERAQKLELQGLKNQGELDQISAHNAGAKDLEEWRIKMRLKYQPKGGVSPVAKLMREYVDLHGKTPDNPDSAGRWQQRLQAIEGQLGRLGTPGQRALQDLSPMASSKYNPQLGTKLQGELAKEGGKFEGEKKVIDYKNDAERPHRELQDAKTRAEILALGGKAGQAPKGDFGIDKNAAAQRQQVSQGILKLAQPQTADPATQPADVVNDPAKPKRKFYLP